MPNEPNLTIPLLLAGAALALLGVMRLGGLGLRRMPRWIGVAAVAAGMGVGALGFLLPDAGEELAVEPRPLPLVSEGPSSQAPDASGAIRGTVETVDGEPVEGADVILRRYRRTEQVGASRTSTDPDGGYAFEDLHVAPDVAYTVEAVHRDAAFPSDLVFLGPHGASSEVDLTVATPTDDAGVLTVAVDSTVLLGDAEGIQVIQITALRNDSGEAYVGPLRLPLLEGAAGLSPREGLVRSRLSVGTDELVSRAPLLPGTTEVIYEYGLATPADARAVERRVHLPTERLDVLVSGDLVFRDRDGMRDAGEVELGADGEERPYHRLTASSLEPGDTVAPVVGLGAGGDALRVALIAAGALLALGIIGVPLLRRRSRTSDPGEPEDREAAAVAEDP